MNGRDVKAKISRRAFLRTVALIGCTAITACQNSISTVISTLGMAQTPIAPGLTPNLTQISTTSPSITPIPNPTLIPCQSDPFEAINNTWKLQPIGFWTDDEKKSTKYGKDAGSLVFPEAMEIVKQGRNDGLMDVAVWLSPEGYLIQFTNTNNQNVWATNELEEPLERPDGNGFGPGRGQGYFVIPSAPIIGEIVYGIGCGYYIGVKEAHTKRLEYVFDSATRTWNKLKKKYNLDLPPVEILSVKEVMKSDLDQGMFSAVELSLQAISKDFFISKWGKGAEGQIIVIVKNSKYPEIELCGCPFYQKGLGSYLLLFSATKLREMEELGIIKETGSDTRFVVNLENGRENIKQILIFFQAIRYRLATNERFIAGRADYTAWMQNFLDNNQNSIFPIEVNLASVFYTSEDQIPLYLKDNAPFSNNENLGEKKDHTVFWMNYRIVVPVNSNYLDKAGAIFRGDRGEKFVKEAPTGSNLSPILVTNEEALNYIEMEDVQSLSLMYLFLAGAGNNKRPLINSIWEEILGRGFTSDYLAILKKFNGVVDWGEIEKKEFPEGFSTYIDYLYKGGKVYPLEFFKKNIYVIKKYIKMSYFTPEIIKFSE